MQLSRKDISNYNSHNNREQQDQTMNSSMSTQEVKKNNLSKWNGEWGRSGEGRISSKQWLRSINIHHSLSPLKFSSPRRLHREFLLIHTFIFYRIKMGGDKPQTGGYRANSRQGH